MKEDLPRRITDEKKISEKTALDFEELGRTLSYTELVDKSIGQIENSQNLEDSNRSDHKQQHTCELDPEILQSVEDYMTEANLSKELLPKLLIRIMKLYIEDYPK